MQILKDEISKHILEVAEDLFYKVGFEDTTTRNIATNVGISVSNLYLYYENKEAIFAAVIDPFYEFISLKLQEFLELKSSKEDINNTLNSLSRLLIMKDRRKFIILIDGSKGTKYENSMNMTIKIISEHISSLLSDAMIDKELVSYVLAKNMINGIVELAKNFKDENQLDDNINYLIAYHLRGIEALL